MATWPARCGGMPRPWRNGSLRCGFEGILRAGVSERVSFLVEKVDQGIRVCVRGRPETEEVIPFAALKKSVNRAAYAYTGKHLGPREKVGNKGGTLSNRLRHMLRQG